MNKIQKEIIEKLKEKSIELGHSPNKREILALATRCYNYFKSFNDAKINAGLDVKNVKQTVFPKNAFNLDKDMAQITSYLTFAVD